MQFVSQR